MTIRNNVTRLLDTNNISYTPHPLLGEKLSALEASEYIGVPPEQVYKTIVAVRTERGKPILGVVSAIAQVDLKILVKIVREKKVKLSSLDQAEKLTGLQSGGISPLALIHKGFDVVLDETALIHKVIYISGGQRELNISLSPHDLVKVTLAKVGDISNFL
ncbi:MAG: aminoacyl-tRNA deacylase [Chloroflexota bacterium]